MWSSNPGGTSLMAGGKKQSKRETGDAAEEATTKGASENSRLSSRARISNATTRRTSYARRHSHLVESRLQSLRDPVIHTRTCANRCPCHFVWKVTESPISIDLYMQLTQPRYLPQNDSKNKTLHCVNIKGNFC